jgi:hypothetical protein
MTTRQLALTALVLTACGSDVGHVAAPSAEPTGGAASAAPAQASAAVAPPTPVDPRVLALAKPVAACTFSDTEGLRQSTCEALKAWDDEQELFKGGAMDASLVTMLEGTVSERYLAAGKLTRFGEQMPEDAALAARVLAIAERERSPAIGRELGRAVGHIHLSKTGLADRVLTMAAQHENKALKAAILERLAFANADLGPKAVEVFRKTIKDPDEEVRRNTTLGLWHTSKEPAACAILVDTFGDSVAQIGIDAMRYAAIGAACEPQLDAILSEVDRRVTAGNADSYEYGILLADVCKRGTPAQKKTSSALASKLLDGKTSGMTRERALIPLAVCNEDWKTAVGKYTKDKDPDVAKTANELVAEGPPRVW